MLSLIFLGEEFNLEGAYGRKLFHQEVDKLYNCFISCDKDEDEKVTRWYIEPDYEYRDVLRKRDVFEHLLLNNNDIDIEEYRKEQERLHQLITNKDVKGLKNFNSKFFMSFIEFSNE